MFVLLSLALTSPVEACSMAFVGDPIGSPRSGAVTPGFAVRPEGVFLNLSIQGPDGENVPFEQDELGQYLLPEDLPAGTYTLFGGWGDGPGLEVEVSEQPPEYWLVPDQDLERDGSLERGERCIQTGLYDPQGELQSEGEVVCQARENLQGCSSSGNSPALLGGFLGLLGLMGLRRRGAGRSVES